ncbi:Adenosine deaminase CECR1-A [Escovopsis weberi]|uniref:adenosine deaminase n=1 Tax=Escovopsis weberi TaxID=150374 RepID=A0A0M8N3Z8_ESCWE|nr:Adenosine deaminase CECR1-A [Escovopsis weberi]
MAMSDEVWRELAQELPSPSDPFLQKYLQGRASLIEQERLQRSDASFRAALSPVARRACAVVQRIRALEERTLWTPGVEERLARETGQSIFPGMMFMMAKERMERRSRLWAIVRRMPKGCLLHAHLDAMVDFDFLIAELLGEPGMHIASDQGLSSEGARELAPLRFRYRHSSSSSGGGSGNGNGTGGAATDQGSSIWGDGYEAGRFVPLSTAADEFPDGGRDGFVAWLKSRCTLALVDSHEQHHGIDAIWDKFARCFAVVATMIHYEPIFRKFLRRLMTLLKRDGVNWAELRFTWPLDYCRDHQEEPETDYRHMFIVADEEISRFKASEEGRGFWGLRFIWTNLRSSATRPLIESMDHCIATKLEFPHLLSGYDVVGPEDLGRPLVSLLPELFWFRKQCAQEGVNIPFFFHAGETLGDGTGADANLFDAVLLGTRRIGHGYSLYKHPLLVDMVRERRILVESCPISNEVLRLCGSVKAHPLPALLARGLPCCLCNDDPAMLGPDTAGMSHDFWQALQGWENLGLAGLGSLAENSVRWAAFEDEEQDEWARGIEQASLGSGIKARRLKEWRVEWEKFCLWIVTEYGDEFGDEDADDEPGEARNGTNRDKADEAHQGEAAS